MPPRERAGGPRAGRGAALPALLAAGAALGVCLRSGSGAAAFGATPSLRASSARTPRGATDVQTAEGAAVACEEGPPPFSSWPPPLAPPAAYEVLEGALTPSEVEGALQAARALAQEFETDDDTVDWQPTYELQLIRSGEWLPEAGSLRSVLEKPLEELLRHARGWHSRHGSVSCDLGNLVVSQALIRRYRPGERREHPVHYDDHAMLTAVASLTPVREGSGLYVQQGASRLSREFVPLGAPGSFAVHGPDLPHGVEVRGDEERFSLIVWFLPEADVGPTNPGTSWTDQLAAAGDASAQFRLGFRLEQSGSEADARHWFQRAAEQGHCPSMHHLGRLLWISGSAEESLPWLWAAARLGYAPAQIELGDRICGGGPPAPPPAPDSEAARLYEEAAAQGHPRGQHRVARLMLWAGDEAGGEALLRKAAESGSDEAQVDLGRLLRLQGELGEAEGWYRKAAKQGHEGAVRQLESWTA